VKNLYYTGQYTHPGVGVPMVLIAAQVVAGVIREATG
jgi:phytoene dehydrogenase-like protein